MPYKPIPLSRHHLRSGWQIEFHGQLRDRARISFHYVLIGVLFFRSRRLRFAGEDKLTGAVEGGLVIGLAADDLELDQVNVLGVTVAGIVDHVPDLGGTDLRVLGDWIIPVFVVQQPDDRKAVRRAIEFRQNNIAAPVGLCRIEVHGRGIEYKWDSAGVL